MTHQVERWFALVPGTMAGGTVSPTTSGGQRNITLYESYEAAMQAAQTTIGGYKGYNWVVIYEAVTIVSRSVPPIEVVDIDRRP